MSLLTRVCTCNKTVCLCAVALCIYKEVNNKLQFKCNKDSKGCELNLETITGVQLEITCPCCEHTIAILTDYELGRCKCYLVFTPINTASLPVGEYNYTIKLTLDTGEILLTQKGKIKIVG